MRYAPGTSRQPRTPGEMHSRRRRDNVLRIEPLELRALLSAASMLDGIVATPTLDPSAVTNPNPVGYTPAQVASAYTFNQIRFNNGAIVGNGAGQTITIVDAYDDPYIASDLAVFNQTFGLTTPFTFTKINQNGGSVMPKADAGWSEEIALDVEWAHAMAPGANIVLVEANSSSISDLLAAVDTARNYPYASVVSMSWGAGEFTTQTQYASHFTTPWGHTGVTFLASAGDSGAGAEWPAASPGVVAVGGTSLAISGGKYTGESAWSGSGGGISRVETEPSYQALVQSTGRRNIPDVAYDASPSSGVAVYDTFAVGGKTGWFRIGGTSAGAPQWAALVVIANQGRSLMNQPTLYGSQAQLYSLPSTDFHDITTGSNGYAAKAGYDLVTGRGTPIANSVVRDLLSSAALAYPAASATGPSTAASPRAAPRHFEIIYWNNQTAVLVSTQTSVAWNVPTAVQSQTLPAPAAALTISPATARVVDVILGQMAPGEQSLHDAADGESSADLRLSAPTALIDATAVPPATDLFDVGLAPALVDFPAMPCEASNESTDEREGALPLESLVRRWDVDLVASAVAAVIAAQMRREAPAIEPPPASRRRRGRRKPRG